MLLSLNLTCQIRRLMGYFPYVTIINVYMGYLIFISTTKTILFYGFPFIGLQQECIYCTVYLFYRLLWYQPSNYITNFIISYYAMFQLSNLPTYFFQLIFLYNQHSNLLIFLNINFIPTKLITNSTIFEFAIFKNFILL